MSEKEKQKEEVYQKNQYHNMSQEDQQKNEEYMKEHRKNPFNKRK